VSHPALRAVRADAARGSRRIARAAVLVGQQRRAAAVGILVAAAGAMAGEWNMYCTRSVNSPSVPGVDDGFSMSKN